MKGGKDCFAITLAGTANEHARRFLELESVVLDCPESLLIKLVGSGGLHPTVALTYLDILACLPDETKRAIISLGHLLGAGDFALWLEAAPHRDIRPRAIVYVERAAPTLNLEQFAAGQILIVPTITAPADMEVMAHDWENCLSLISRHVDLGFVLGRVLTTDHLRELLLIDSHAVDQMLALPVPAAPSLPDESAAVAQLDLGLEERTNRANQ